MDDLGKAMSLLRVAMVEADSARAAERVASERTDASEAKNAILIAHVAEAEGELAKLRGRLESIRRELREVTWA